MERSEIRSTKAEYFMSDDNETLLIDDDEADVELALHAVRGKKLVDQILVLRDGEEALDYLFGPGHDARSASGQTPKLILLDLKLPKVYGVEVLRRLEHAAKPGC
jgi:two-component system response regulator